MKKNLLLFVFSFLLVAGTFAQAPDLDRILARINVKYPPMETLEEVAIQLHYYDNTPPSQLDEPRLLEALKTLSNGYAANVHFKQAYNIFQRYLSLKENILARQKAELLAKTKDEYNRKDKTDADQVASLESQTSQLRQEQEGLISSRSNFKKVFSGIIVVLTFLFAISLVRSGVRMKKIMEETRLNHDKLMLHHRVATLGYLKEGVESTLASHEGTLKKAASDASSRLSASGSQAAKEVQSLLGSLAK